MEKKILFLRKKIDKIDSQIFRLLKKRFGLSKEIGKYKKEKGFFVKDKEREKEIINKALKKSRLGKKFILSFYKLIFKESRRLQK